MKKLDNSGFVLVETLLVTAFVAVAFTVLYTNFSPLVGEYAKRENYDDIDSVYATFWIKKFLQSDDVDLSLLVNKLNTKSYTIFTCNDIVNNEPKRTFCNNLLSELKVTHIYLLRYKIPLCQDTSTNCFRKDVYKNDSGDFSQSMQDYVRFLPTYSSTTIFKGVQTENAVSENGANYRIIVEFKRLADTGEYYTYANMEVIK